MKSQAILARTRFAQMRPEFFQFDGGLDQMTPPLFVKPGTVREAQNYECDINGGYIGTKGYERFDGHPSPSDADYAIIGITLTGSIAVADTVTGVTSAATAVVIATPDSTSIVVTKISGTFVSGETLNVGGTPRATTTSAALVGSASTTLLNAQYLNLAADAYRSDISAVPGSGNILGIWKTGGIAYAWRNNAGGTAAAIYKSSASGWTAVTLYNEVSFTAGGASTPAEGATITQGANTATLKRVVLTSGSWSLGTAAGRLIVTTPAPGSFAAGAATIGAINVTLSGAQSAITLQPNGRYEIEEANFGGSVNTRRMYGCDGVNRGFEFDGDVFVPISTGMTSDAPSHLAIHKNHLFFSFGASVQHSGPGTPYIWSAILGAAELAMGDTVNGFKPQPGAQTTGALAIFTRNRTAVLYGTGSSDWNLVTFRDELGAYAYSIQDVGETVFLDDRGIYELRTVQEYGNFSSSSLTAQIRDLTNSARTKITASCISRDKSQYRVFFSDSTALYITFRGHKAAGVMPMLFSNPVRCVCSVEESNGSETILFGSTNGMVYQMEKGTSFDGEEIERYLTFAYNFSKSPRVLKSYQRCALEVAGSGYATFNFSYALGYGSTDIEQPAQETISTSFSPVYWDAFTWDAFTWDGVSLMPATASMAGTAENFSIMIRSKSDYHEPIRFSGARVEYVLRRTIR